MWVSTLAFVVVYSLLIPVGLYARNILPGGLAETDMVVPQLLTTPGVFTAGVGAFLLLAMVAAAMSSLDSVLLVMASTAQRDIVGHAAADRVGAVHARRDPALRRAVRADHRDHLAETRPRGSCG